jgi:natural product biosynthesis luciferase-like monooxygenase protein
MGLSLASGWHADDFVLDPEAYEDRKDVLQERLAVLRTLWAGDAVVRRGPGGRDIPTRVFPRPERAPDIWLTSSVNPATWETAGRLGLHVLTALLEQTVDDVADKVGHYRQALARAGHTVPDKQVTCMVHTHIAANADVVADRVRPPLTQYLTTHLRLFEKFATHNDIGVRTDAVSDSDRAILVEHGLRRYMSSAGLFGSVDTCRPMIDRLATAGVTEVGALVDFGLPPEQVLECVAELGRLQAMVRT